MKALLERLENEPLIRDFSQRKVTFSHLSLVQESLLIAASFKLYPQNMIIVKPNLYQAQHLVEKLQLWLGDDVYLYAAEESLRVEAIAASPELNVGRIDVLSKVQNDKAKVIITHLGALLRYLPPLKTFKALTIDIKVNQIIQPKILFEQLRRMGYTETNRVDQPCTSAHRGGIIDVFPVNSEEPIRIEFFDNEIESIRSFDLSTQRSVESLTSITVQPASDLLFTDEEITILETKLRGMLNERQTKEGYSLLEETVENDLELMRLKLKENHLYRYRAFMDDSQTLLDYVQDPLVIASSAEDIKEHHKILHEETLDYLLEMVTDHKSLPIFEVFADYGKIVTKVRTNDLRRFETTHNLHLPFRELDIPSQSLLNHVKMIVEELKTKTVVCCLKEAEIKQLIPILQDQHVTYSLKLKDLDQPHLILLLQDLDEGFELISQDIVVYSSKELFNHKVFIGRYNTKFKEAETLHSYQDLQPGDFVVHHQHGVGKYIGIITKEMEGQHRDYLHIVYRHDATLYVPLEQFQLVRKFVSKEGVVPKLHTLGSNEWKKTKARIRENVLDLAERLINLYGQREHDIAHAFGPDIQMQIDFESEFEYPLTHDQATAISDIKRDMMSTVPMDRLLCGDVGFGKTEVAIRAAFKAVVEHKQVAFLCPTTVLSAQHFHTYPISVALLNRFVPDHQVKLILHALKEGKIDVLIGTHRLLSKNVQFKDLGLLVIDEEQRFGVEHKEKIKEIKTGVHVLSLSATPIPRTLQMSLVGVRSLSQLDSPPLNRLPILTYVIEKNRAVIKDIIQRELARKGQVFYLYNKVEDILQVAFKLKQDLPDAEIAVAHGQMHRDEIEDVMMRFTSNEVNVLVCTTIVETGIDIPNANTMIIDQADTFGLSQLYQIKGRVGRSDRLAYAYLMYNPKKQLSELAAKRLQSIKEFTELGSGYKIAMRDLTIRGAGEMLGDMQSGFIDTVGIDMYIEMLEQAIKDKRAGIITEEQEPQIKTPMGIDGYIPSAFEHKDFEKLSLYQTIEKADTESALRKLQEETADLYGKLPKSVQLLFEKKRWELLLSSPIIDSAKELKHQMTLTYTKHWSSTIDGVKLFERINSISPSITLKYLHEQIVLIIPKQDDWLFLATSVLVASSKVPQRS
ncbi:MAG: transcription-repair coupling [Erysipelotrichaceae bacterium]|nr:MAG: transcription-repair coupling [Erysipelotrichaceae bacterium]